MLGVRIAELIAKLLACQRPEGVLPLRLEFKFGGGGGLVER